MTTLDILESILPRDNVAILVSNDQGQCIFSQEGSKVYSLHPPKDQPEIQGKSIKHTTKIE